MKKHKHCELIKAWADGATIQFKHGDTWITWDEPATIPWHLDDQFRIKPEPKPDVVCFTYCTKGGTLYWVYDPNTADANLKLTFDGETGDLIKAEVLKS